MSRAKAREVAMKQLYAYEMGGECTYIAALQAREEEDDTSRSPSQMDELFAAQLFQGILDNINGIDPYIIEQSRGWSIERIASLERIILRMAIFEMKFSSDEVPVSAIINEAVNLAKKYGSNDRAGAYVNGVLGGVVRRTGEPPLPLDVQKAMAEAEAEAVELLVAVEATALSTEAEEVAEGMVIDALDELAILEEQALLDDEQPDAVSRDIDEEQGKEEHL